MAVAPAQAEGDGPQDTDLVHRPITVEEEVSGPDADSLHGRSGKSRFPALARLFGRWNTQGQFAANVDPYDDEFDSVPRDRFLRPLAIVVATAAISFFIVVALLRLRDSAVAEPASTAAPLAAPAPAPTPAPAAAPVPPPARAAAPAPVARPIAAPPPATARSLALPAPRTIDLPPALAVKDTASAPVKRTVARRRPRRLPLDPDAPIPLAF